MKKIIFATGITQTMSFEEVLNKFMPMLNKFTNDLLSKFKSIERDDVLQELKLETWKAYQEYNGIACFSTFLTYKLRKVKSNLSRKLMAKKRTAMGVVSLSKQVIDNEDLTIEELIGEDCYIDSNMIAYEMLNIIMNELDEREKLEFKSLLFPSEINSTTIAKELNISRQAANEKIRRTKLKCQRLLLNNL